MAKKKDIEPVSDESKINPVLSIRHPKKRAMIEALSKTLGNVSQACKLIEKQGAGIDRQTHYNWLKADEAYAKAVDAIADMELDFAESKLRELMQGVTVSRVDNKGNEHIYSEPPNVTAVMFYLNNKGARRNYGNKIEVKHTKGSVIDPEMPSDE